MRKRILFVILMIIPVFGLQAQDEYAKNAVYLELAGNGGLYSLNYERALSPKFLIRVGFASWEPGFLIMGGEKSITTIPLMVNSLFGQSHHKIEGGLGVMLGSEKFTGDNSFLSTPDSKENIFALTGTAGYRYQKPSGGIIFRSAITPFINMGDSEYPDFNISVGGSIGYAF